VERFRWFLADTPHALLQTIRTQLVQTLWQWGVIQGHHLGLDSCPLASWVRENNLKTSLHSNRCDKTSLPRGDPDARLGVRIHYPYSDKTEVEYFWGYRNHTVADLEVALPWWEITPPNSVGQVTVAIPFISPAVSALGWHPQALAGDAQYDVEALLRSLFDDLKAKPFIPDNPRNAQDKSGFRRDGQQVFCPARLPRHRHGRMTVKGIPSIQYRCPLHFGPPQELLLCPTNQIKFNQPKGCHDLWRLTDTARDQIPYGTEEFKQHDNRCTALERIFSRRRTITLEDPGGRSLASVTTPSWPHFPHRCLAGGRGRASPRPSR
jgi:hypothetical protein